MNPWRMVLPGLLLVFLATSPLYSQIPFASSDSLLIPTTPGSIPRELRSEDVLYPRRPGIEGRFVLYSFQRYDEIEAMLDAMQSLPGSEQLLMNALHAGEGDQPPPLPPDYGVASFGIPAISARCGKKHSTMYSLLRGILTMGMQFGYGYLREQSRAMSSSDIDALHLPGGPGIFRDMNAVMDESMMRSDVGTMRIWQDLRYRERLRRNREARRADVRK